MSTVPEGRLRTIAACITSGPSCPPEWGATFARYLRELLVVTRGPGVASEQTAREAARETGAHPDVLHVHQALWAPSADGGLLFRAVAKEYDYGRDVERRLDRAMRAIAELHEARLVVTGHTHAPFARSTERCILANSGTWTPLVGRGAERSRPLGSFVWATSDGPHLVANLRHVWPSGVVS